MSKLIFLGVNFEHLGLGNFTNKVPSFFIKNDWSLIVIFSKVMFPLEIRAWTLLREKPSIFSDKILSILFPKSLIDMNIFI